MRLAFRDFLDIALGGTILGTGGGGSYETARHLADTVLRRKVVRVVPLDEVPDRSRVVSIAGMGSPEAMLKTPFTTEAVHAFDALKGAGGPAAKYVVPLETSGFNFLTPMAVAASRPVVVIDGDAAGRAIPRLNQTLFHAHHVRLAPLALADAGGRSIVIRADEYSLSEKAAIAALEHFGWSAGLACYPMDGKTVKRAAVPGTVSLANAVGRAVRLASLSHADAIDAILSITGGRRLVQGAVDRFDTETAGSYTFGDLEILGSGADAGTHVKIKSMNENMLAWKNERIAAIAPDRICFVTPDGRPTTNADIRVGDEIVVLVIEAQRNWRSKRATNLFRPTLTAMGFNGPYVPAKSLLGSGRGLT